MDGPNNLACLSLPRVSSLVYCHSSPLVPLVRLASFFEFSVILVGKAGAFLSGVHYSATLSVWASGLKSCMKYKHSSLFCPVVGDEEKQRDRKGELEKISRGEERGRDVERERHREGET